MPVVERDVGRRPDDDEHAAAIEPELVEDRRGRARSRGGSTPPSGPGSGAPSRARAEAVEPLLRDRLGNDDARRRAAAEPVLGARELVVERVRRTGCRATARPSAARARRARARRRIRGRSRTAAARGADRPSRAPSRRRPRRRVPGRRPRARSRAASSSSIVCAYSRVVTSTSCPRSCSSAISGRKNGTCGEFEMSIQTRTTATLATHG